jgi:anti-anti-sigma factor
MSYSMDLIRTPRGHVVTISGELDMAAEDQVLATTRTAAEQWALPRSKIMVDVSSVTFVDGAGLGALDGARAAALRSDRIFQLRGASAQMRRLMSVAGLWDLLETQLVPELRTSRF